MYRRLTRDSENPRLTARANRRRVVSNDIRPACIITYLLLLLPKYDWMDKCIKITKFHKST